jgi:hypothetical protein
MTEKHAGGRPRKYQSVEEMSTAIDAYFDECDVRMVQVVTKKGDVVEVHSPAPYTVMGLANELGIDRDTLNNYSSRSDEFGEEFFGTIKAAREKVHQNLEFRLLDGAGYGPGHIFGLKNNYGWKDKQEIDQKTSFSVHFDKEDENA